MAIVLDVYTDGSYLKDLGVVGWGLVMYKPNSDFQVAYECNGATQDPDLVKQNNVAGEILGACKAIEVAQLTGANIRILYDYEGVEKWLTGEYKARSPLAQAYVQVGKESYDKGVISFQKVDAHVGVGNKRADKLARMATRGEFINGVDHRNK